MKKKLLALLTIFACTSIGADAQRVLNISGKEYDAKDIQDITYRNLQDVTVDAVLAKQSEYRIFSEALKLTGLQDTLRVTNKGKKYHMEDPTDRDNFVLHYPTECAVGYTVFAEKDEVMRNNDINSVQDLIAYCNSKYAESAEWYDYLREKGIKVSTGTDYRNPFNALNMFMAYHIIKGAMPVDKLTYELNDRTKGNWNVCFGYEPQEYYETLLPHTLLKVWNTAPKTTKDLRINRYRKNNTLTDEIGTFGNDATHPIIFEGVSIDREASIETFNGCIHSIKSMLVYDKLAVASQQERMRFDVTNLLPEIADNGYRQALVDEVAQYSPSGNGNRVAFPSDFFENMQCYNPNTILRYCIMGAWRAFNSSQFQGWGEYDFAIKLPHVPTGTYEIRTCYALMSRGGQMQFYLGNSIDNMQKAGDPIDASMDPTESDNIMGCTEIETEYDNPNTDYGVASDKEMRKHGFMRAPASFSRGTYNTITDKLTYDPTDIYSAARNIVGSTSCRSEWGYGTMMLRYIVATVNIKQGEDTWLRIENLSKDPMLGWNQNFIELVPVSVCNNKDMSEDWY